jgi:phosphatidylinositol alpha-1,6-mannosyltransferase
MKHLLVTNDFPPKLGGIQSYLWELWRRLPPESTTVLTTPRDGASAFDAVQPIRVERDRARVLLPTASLVRRIDALAAEVDADLVLLDPALPLGQLGPRLERPYGVVLHGAEVTVPGRLPLARPLLARVLREARIVIAAGGYPAAEAERAAGRSLPSVIVPPGVDPDRFVPATAQDRARTRSRFGVDPDAFVVLGLSRLVPRKGFDVLIDAAARLAPRYQNLQVLVAGSGRDRGRLERRAEQQGSPIRFLGRVPEADLADLHASADLFAMLCRDRWGGLEQEGFGIVFLEAGSAGIAAIAGRSGGSAEAVVDGLTGLVLDDPRDVEGVSAAIERLIIDQPRRRALGAAARRRVLEEFTYTALADHLHQELEKLGRTL